MRVPKRPCGECPFRRDTPPGQFPAERYAALENTHGVPGREAWIDAPWFGCHKMPDEIEPGQEIACAGWLAVEGLNHLGVRLAVCHGKVPAEAFRPREGWPELFASYAEMAAAQAGPPRDRAMPIVRPSGVVAFALVLAALPVGVAP